jgi:hypothetical protein
MPTVRRPDFTLTIQNLRAVCCSGAIPSARSLGAVLGLVIATAGIVLSTTSVAGEQTPPGAMDRSGYFRLQLKHGGKYLDAKYCGDEVGMNPGSDFEDGACQLWRLVPVDNGWSRLQLKHGSKYLDAKYCSDEVGMNPGSDFEDGACQLWRLVRAGDGWSRLQLKHGNKYLDAKYCSDEVGMNPGSNFENGACQLWRVVPESRAGRQ